MKRVRRFAESRWRYLLYALVCFLILVFGLMKNGFSAYSWQYWFGQVFLITAMFWIFGLLISSKNRFVGRSTPEFNSELKAELDNADAETGYFKFSEEGFTFAPQSVKFKMVNWNDIIGVYAWIEDQIVVDDVLCIRLNLKNNQFIEFDEIAPGFLTFLTHCHNKLACFPEGWINRLSSMDRRELILFMQ